MGEALAGAEAGGGTDTGAVQALAASTRKIARGMFLIERALLTVMALGRTVVATRIGGPPEFVPPEAGVLVDPADDEALADALRAAAGLPCPNPAARTAAEAHDVRLQAEKVERVLELAAQGPRA